MNLSFFVPLSPFLILLSESVFVCVCFFFVSICITRFVIVSLSAFTFVASDNKLCSYLSTYVAFYFVSIVKPFLPISFRCPSLSLSDFMYLCFISMRDDEQKQE